MKLKNSVFLLGVLYILLSCRQREEINQLQSKVAVNICQPSSFSELDEKTLRPIIYSSAQIKVNTLNQKQLTGQIPTVGTAFFINEDGYLYSSAESAYNCLTANSISNTSNQELQLPISCPNYQIHKIKSHQCQQETVKYEYQIFSTVELIAITPSPTHWNNETSIDQLWNMYPNSYAIYKVGDPASAKISNDFIRFNLQNKPKMSEFLYQFGFFSSGDQLEKKLETKATQYEAYLNALNKYNEIIQQALSFSKSVQTPVQFETLKTMVKKIIDQEKQYHNYLKKQVTANLHLLNITEKHKQYEQILSSSSSEAINEFLSQIEDQLITSKTCALKRLADTKILIGLRRTSTHKLTSIPSPNLSRTKVQLDKALDEDYAFLLQFIINTQKASSAIPNGFSTETILGAEKLKELISCSPLLPENLGVDNPAIKSINSFLDNSKESKTDPYLKQLNQSLKLFLPTENIEQLLKTKQFFLTNNEITGFSGGHLLFDSKGRVLGSTYDQYLSIIDSFESINSEGYWHWNAGNANLLNFIHSTNQNLEKRKLPIIKIYQ